MGGMDIRDAGRRAPASPASDTELPRSNLLPCHYCEVEERGGEGEGSKVTGEKGMGDLAATSAVSQI